MVGVDQYRTVSNRLLIMYHLSKVVSLLINDKVSLIDIVSLLIN